jgi:hypothetical protein
MTRLWQGMPREREPGGRSGAGQTVIRDGGTARCSAQITRRS